MPQKSSVSLLDSKNPSNHKNSNDQRLTTNDQQLTTDDQQLTTDDQRHKTKQPLNYENSSNRRKRFCRQKPLRST